MLRRLIPVLALLLLVSATALAADVQTIDMDSTGDTVRTACGYIRLTCEIAGEQTVAVTVRNADGRVTYQRDHGMCGGSFRSEDIPLKKSGSYRVALAVGGEERTVDVQRLLPEVSRARASTAGHKVSKSVTVTMVDTSSNGSTQAELVSGGLKVGTVSFTVNGDALTAHVSMERGATLEDGTVYAAVTRSEASRLGGKHSSCASAELGETVALDGADVCAVYLSATVSFDPNGLDAASSENDTMQDALWQLLP